MGTAFKWDQIFKDLTLDNKAKSSTIHLKFKDQIFGPILPEELQEYVQYLKEENIYFKEDQDQEWQLIVHHPLYQRRKSESILKECIQKDIDLYILKNGQKKGPYSYSQLQIEVEKLTYLITDYVSLDFGKSWKKLCEFKEFDRRFFKHNHLPFTLEGEAPITIEHELIHKGEEEDIAKVAFLEHQHKNQDHQNANPSNIINENNKTNNIENEIPKSNLLVGMIITTIILITVYLFLGSNTKNIRSKQLKEIRTPHRPSRTIQSYQPKIKTQPKNIVKRKNIPIQQKSIIDSKSYKNRFRIGESIQKDIIDRERNPYEQDQVQKMLSKETLYPEDFEDLSDSASSAPDEDDWVKRLEEQNRKARAINRNAELYYEDGEEDLLNE